MWLCCASAISISLGAERQSNWTSPDTPCAKFDDLRKPLIGTIGVKIDAAEPWADGFRRAIRFWNTVLIADFHEETGLKTVLCELSTAPPPFLVAMSPLGPNSPTGPNFEGRSRSARPLRKK